MKSFFGIDRNSLKFRLWLHFTVFAVIIMAFIWFMQVFMMDNYYEQMKIRETQTAATQIKNMYGSDGFIPDMRALLSKSDMYVHVETADGNTIIFSPQNDVDRRPIYAYVSEMANTRDALLKSGQNEVSFIVPEPNSSANVLAYASFMDTADEGRVILYIFSPLYPVASTVSILRHQMIYIIIFAVSLALILSFFLANRIIKPIKKIDDQAMNLAHGKFGIVFQGGRYTEITDLADTLTYTSLQLEKADSMQKDLFANVSHDIRTPLTMIKSYAEMIRDLSGDDPDKRAEHLGVIIDETDRLNLLVSDMMTLSRMQTGAIVLNKAEFDLAETFRSVIPTYSYLEETEGYDIRLECPEHVMVRGDEERIKQVITNLVNNAVKYCGADKQILINVSVSKGVARCSVTDHGMGIAKEELPLIWDRYYKASTNHVRNTSGTGLGLSIVKEIMTLHNSKFGADSEVGRGSTFWFEMPVVKVKKGKQSGSSGTPEGRSQKKQKSEQLESSGEHDETHVQSDRI